MCSREEPLLLPDELRAKCSFDFILITAPRLRDRDGGPRGDTATHREQPQPRLLLPLMSAQGGPGRSARTSEHILPPRPHPPPVRSRQDRGSRCQESRCRGSRCRGHNQCPTTTQLRPVHLSPSGAIICPHEANRPSPRPGLRVTARGWSRPLRQLRQEQSVRHAHALGPCHCTGSIHHLLTEPGSNQSADDRLREEAARRSFGEVPVTPLRQALGRQNSLRRTDPSTAAREDYSVFPGTGRPSITDEPSLYEQLFGEGGKGR